MRNTYRKLAMPALAAAAAALSGAGVAKADFSFTIVTTAFSTDTVYVVRAFDNGLNSTGTQLGGIDSNIIVTSGGPMVVQFTDIDGDGVPDYNILGQSFQGGLGAVAVGSSLGTWIHLGANFTPTATIANGGANPYPNRDWQSDPGANNQVGNSVPVTPQQAPNAAYASMTQFRIASTGQAVNAPAGGVPIINLVVPNGSAGYINPEVADVSLSYISKDTTLYFGSTPVSQLPIVSLTSTAPTAMGSQLGGLMVNGANGKYKSSITTNGNLKGPLALTAGYSTVSGFSSTPSNDAEIFLLKLSSSANDAQIISDIQASGASTNLVASAVAAGLQGMDGITWDIELVDLAPGAEANGYFGFNLANAPSSDIGSITVTAVDAVPEPATLGLLALSGIGLLARRRRA